MLAFIDEEIVNKVGVRIFSPDNHTKLCVNITRNHNYDMHFSATLINLFTCIQTQVYIFLMLYTILIAPLKQRQDFNRILNIARIVEYEGLEEADY